MDEQVIQAMAKWPNVPDCYGWLGLDRRGDWYMRDAAAQARGPFCGPKSTPLSKGSRLEHRGLCAFIGRNFHATELGEWYFQNGPQRVYVELEVTPWVLRLEQDGRVVVNHVGAVVDVGEWLVDEVGLVYGLTPLGLGLVHAQDMWDLSEKLDREGLEIRSVASALLPQRYGYCCQPQPDTKKPTIGPAIQ